MALVECTVTYDARTTEVTDDDDDSVVDLPALIGWVTFTPQISDGGVAHAVDYSPRPTAFSLRPRMGYIDTDGQLKNQPGGTVGLTLIANDPILNLTRLPYKVTFALTDPIGNEVRITPTTFDAPDDDSTFNLLDVMPVPGATAIGIPAGGSEVSPEDIADAVEAYLTDNPVSGISGISDGPVLTHNLDASGYNVGPAEVGDLVKLHALTATATELNYVDGVTSAIQTQLGTKQATSSLITDVTTALHAATSKTLPETNDEMLITDSSASYVTKKMNLGALTAAVKTYFDTLYQPTDGDLTTIAGLTATTDSFLQSKSSAWSVRTVAQVKTDLGLTGTNSGDQTSVTGNAGTATALATARALQTNLASTSAVNFDGTAANTHGVTGTLPVANGGTGAATLTGIVKGSGTSALSAATAGTDYVTPTGTETLSAKTLTNPTINNYTEGVVTIGTVTSSNTIALTSGTVQTATLTASTACTFTMPTATAGKSFVLLLKQAASTGLGTATFTSVKWGTAGAPTITATAGKMDILTFVSDGTNWYGSVAAGFTP